MANLRVNLDKAIYAVLNVSSVTNEASGGVFNVMAPQGTAHPYVIFQAVSDIYLLEDFNGVIYQHVGGMYQIIADES